MKLMTLFLNLILLSSCSIIDGLHQEMDGGAKRVRRRKSPLSYYKKSLKQDTNSLRQKYLNSEKNKTVLPRIKRSYGKTYQRHFKAEDLVDNSNISSLWANQGVGSGLFSRSKSVSQGDIIVMQVQKDLKDKITQELALAFPKKKAPKKGAADNTSAPNAQEGNTNDTAAANTNTNESEDKIYDRISGFIAEEISQNHLIVKGRKEVLFRGKKHMVEVEGLVARRNISDEDMIQSNKMIESSVRVTQ